MMGKRIRVMLTTNKKNSKMKTGKQPLPSSTCTFQGGPEWPLYHSPPKGETPLKKSYEISGQERISRPGLKWRLLLLLELH